MKRLNIVFSFKRHLVITEIGRDFREIKSEKSAVAIETNYNLTNRNGIFYYNGKQAVTDILNYYLIKSKKNSENIQRLIDFYKDKTIPKMPVGAEFLMKKFNIPEGKQLGAKLKKIEEEWVKNNFQISDKQVSQIVNN